MHRALKGFSRLFVLLGLVALCYACADAGGLTISGCTVSREHPTGGWRGDPYELHPFFTAVRLDQFKEPACPVPILQTREQVYTVGVLWSNQVFNPQTGTVTDTERATLRIFNAAGTQIAEDVQPFFPQAGNIDYKQIELTETYPAVSGHLTFTEKDLMQVRISDYCCSLPQLRGELELQVSYSRDQAAATVTAVGDEIPPRNVSTTFGVLSRSAGRPHTYRWYRDGVYAGTGNTLTTPTGTADFNLRVDMTDQYGRTASNTLRVDVDGVRVGISGPDMAYVWTSPRDTAPTWRAMPRGGTPPFTYTWYRSGWWAGEGEYHSEHIDERADFELRVEIRDAAGATHGATHWVRVAERSCTTSGCVSY